MKRSSITLLLLIAITQSMTCLAHDDNNAESRPARKRRPATALTTQVSDSTTQVPNSSYVSGVATPTAAMQVESGRLNYATAASAQIQAVASTMINSFKQIAAQDVSATAKAAQTALSNALSGSWLYQATTPPVREVMQAIENYAPAQALFAQLRILAQLYPAAATAMAGSPSNAKAYWQYVQSQFGINE